MQAVQRQIAEELKVQPPFSDTAALEAEVARRITFIQCCLHNSGLKTLVLGISGGVDSLTAGLMAQRAVKQLREQTGDQAYRFIAVRLPYGVQHDEIDATAAVDFINPDERQTVNIGPAVKALAAEVSAFEGKPHATVDFVLGNTKARMRMVAQYTIAGATGGLVIGTDHAAEAVMGFFTKSVTVPATWHRSAGWSRIRCARLHVTLVRQNRWWRKSRPQTLKTWNPANLTKHPTA